MVDGPYSIRVVPGVYDEVVGDVMGGSTTGKMSTSLTPALLYPLGGPRRVDGCHFGHENNTTRLFATQSSRRLCEARPYPDRWTRSHKMESKVGCMIVFTVLHNENRS